MALIVQKFGGTSLADPVSRDLLVGKVKKALLAKDQVVLVVSAMGREGDAYATDTLLGLLSAFPGGKGGLVSDLMVSCGETISACVIAALLTSRGVDAVPLTAYTAGIHAEGPYGDANPSGIDSSRIQDLLHRGLVPVVTGFQGVDASGNMLTLGRGGSDTSAAALGAALRADFVDIYKDVPGVAKADPRIIKNPPFMEFIDYDSMFRLARHGARVLHDKSALIARDAGLSLRVRSTFDDGPGTLIAALDGVRVVPDFIGMSTSKKEEGMKVTAVFRSGRGAELAKAAKAAANTIGLGAVPLDCDDPDAAAFMCESRYGVEFAVKLFSRLA
jgi:aspartate kinase